MDTIKAMDSMINRLTLLNSEAERAAESVNKFARAFLDEDAKRKMTPEQRSYYFRLLGRL